MFYELKDENGSMMILSIIFIVVLGILGLAIGNMAINNSRLSSESEKETEAFHIAQGALDYYLNETVDELYKRIGAGERDFYIDEFVYDSSSNNPFNDADELETYFADSFFPSGGHGVADNYLERLNVESEWDIEVDNFKYTWENGDAEDAAIEFEVRVFESGSSEPIKVIRRQTGIDAFAIVSMASSSLTGGEITTSDGVTEENLEIKGKTTNNVKSEFFEGLLDFDRYKERAKDLGNDVEDWEGLHDTGISTDARTVHYLGKSTPYVGETANKKNKSHQYPTILYVDGDITIKGRDGLHLNNHYIIATGEVNIESSDSSDGSTKNNWNWERDENGNIKESAIDKDRLPNYDDQQLEQEKPGQHINDQKENFTKNDGVANNSFIYGESGINVTGDSGIKTATQDEEPTGDNIINKEEKWNFFRGYYWEYEYTKNSNFDNLGMMMTPGDIEYSNGEQSQNKIDYSNLDIRFLLGMASNKIRPIDDYVKDWEEII
ncbi:MAG: hypothetical protein ACQEP9_02185 [Bacillota bacterium]